MPRPPRRDGPGPASSWTARVLRRAARALDRAASRLSPPASPARQPGQPPDHWLRLVAEHAPGLLHDPSPPDATPSIPPGAPLVVPPALITRSRPWAALPLRVTHSVLSLVRPPARPSSPTESPLPPPLSSEQISVPRVIKPQDHTRNTDLPRSAAVTATQTPLVAPARVSSQANAPVRSVRVTATEPVHVPFPSVPSHEARPLPSAHITATTTSALLPPTVTPSAPLRTTPPALSQQISVPRVILGIDYTQNTDLVEREVGVSPWPELPDDTEVWRVPEGPARDREARLDREQAGG